MEKTGKGGGGEKRGTGLVEDDESWLEKGGVTRLEINEGEWNGVELGVGGWRRWVLSGMYGS